MELSAQYGTTKLVEDHWLEYIQHEDVGFHQLIHEGLNYVESWKLIEESDLASSFASRCIDHDGRTVIGPENMLPLNTFIDVLTQFIDGFPHIWMVHLRSLALFGHVNGVSDVRDNRPFVFFHLGSEICFLHVLLKCLVRLIL